MTSALNNIARYKIIAAVIANILAFFAMLYIYSKLIFDKISHVIVYINIYRISPGEIYQKALIELGASAVKGSVPFELPDAF